MYVILNIKTMWSTSLVILMLILQFINVNSEGDYDAEFETTTNILPEQEEQEGEKVEKTSDFILKVLDHYKHLNVEGLPGVKIPDPYYMSDVRQTIGIMTNIDFKNTALHGVNKYRVLYVNGDVEKLQCHAAFEMDKLQITGNYSANMWFNSYPGAFTSEIVDIKSNVIITLGVQQDGKLRAQNISIDITFKTISVQFENAGFLATLFQGIFNSLGSMLYESIKPSLLEDAHINMRNEINKKLDQFVGDIEFPNTISPMDMVIVDVRNKMRDVKMDPMRIEDFNSSVGVFKIALYNIWVEGLSTFHNIEKFRLRLENNTIIAGFYIGTQELKGSTEWEISGINRFICTTGSISFTVSYIGGRIVIAQALDVRKRIHLRDLHLDVGNVQLRSDGMGTLDYILEAVTNILPNLLRYQIMASMKNPVKWKLQQELDHINVEESINNVLPDIDRMVDEGFQLSALRILSSTNDNYGDDDFFNF